MRLFALLAALAFLTLGGAHAAGAEETQCLRGGADAPLHTNRFGQSAIRSRVGFPFGTVQYVPWKNSCVRVPPVVAGQPLEMPEAGYSLVAPYVVHLEPQPSFLNVFMQSLLTPPAG